MLRGQRGSQGCHRRFKSRLIKAEEIHIPFHHENAGSVQIDMLFCTEQSKKLASLTKNGAFCRIEVFGPLPLAYNSSAKTNDFPAQVFDRKDHATMKNIEEAPLG